MFDAGWQVSQCGVIRSVVLQMDGQGGQSTARMKLCNVEARVAGQRKNGKHTRNESDYLNSGGKRMASVVVASQEREDSE